MFLKFFSKKEFWEIEIFQLQNLIANSLSFEFFYLCKKSELSFFSNLKFQELRSAKVITPDQALEDIKKLINMDLSIPVILICKNQKLSNKMANKLIKLKLINVYVVKGGLESLKEYYEENK